MRLRPDAKQAILEAVGDAWEAGCPVASPTQEIAEVASRRLGSVARRLGDTPSEEAISKDLAKGMIAAFEQDATIVGKLKKDYEFLADRVVGAALQLAEGEQAKDTKPDNVPS